MSIIFIVLGLGFLAGGAYAIVEGWPYILIERGFTLVIVGTVLMTAGVLMLALSRVMAELRRVRGQLSSAVMAFSVASMVNARDEREPGPSLSSAPPQAADASGLRAGPAVLGGALAAGGILAAGAAAAASHGTPEAQDAAAPGEAGDTVRDDEPDLFATPRTTETPIIGTAEPFAPILWSEPDAAAAPETQAESEAGTSPVAAPDDFAAALAKATGEAEPGPMADEPFGMPETTPATAIDVDFDRLRDRLAGERREASASEIDAAADWMTAIRPGQDRWFETYPPAMPEPEIASEPEVSPDTPVAPPVWPPQTREAAPFAPEEEFVASPGAEADEPDAGIAEPAQTGVAAEREPEPLPSFALPPRQEPELHPESEPMSAPDEAADPEPEAEPAPVGPPAPAASEEGVVGAYQVGTAHFTIYADGSIQARTPDGDYSFASMDELKTYLASEKSRLGA